MGGVGDPDTPEHVPYYTTWDEENETWNLGDAYYIYSHGEHLEEKINGLSMSSAYNFENGLTMFLFQAQKAFNIWHNIEPDIDEETINLSKN